MSKQTNIKDGKIKNYFGLSPVKPRADLVCIG